MRISDWSSDVCSSDLTRPPAIGGVETRQPAPAPADGAAIALVGFRSGRRAARCRAAGARRRQPDAVAQLQDRARYRIPRYGGDAADRQFGLDARAADRDRGDRSEEHTSELQSLMR